MTPNLVTTNRFAYSGTAVGRIKKVEQRAF
jgi:hypothetical protein